MQCKARKAFSSRYGMMRPGNIFSSDPDYAKELQKLGMIEILPAKLGPDRIQAHTTAPHIKTGKELSTENPQPSPNQDSAGLKDDGEAKPSSASRPVRRSRKRT